MVEEALDVHQLYTLVQKHLGKSLQAKMFSRELYIISFRTLQKPLSCKWKCCRAVKHFPLWQGKIGMEEYVASVPQFCVMVP